MHGYSKHLRLVLIAALGLALPPAAPSLANQLPVQTREGLSQTRTIKGMVFDDLGEPLIGVSILVKGTKLGCSTDIDGAFEILLPKQEKVTLVINYVGMKTKEVEATTGSSINITLEPSVDMLDAVIVSGFHTISRERNTGSAVVINADKLAKVQSADLGSKLEGISPGLTIYNNQMSIRGNSSLSISSTPLLVVDGQPTTGMSLSDINPETIENVTVLKDAAATSLYGVYASNGVIVVTTKRGADNKIQANISASFYLNSLPSLDYQHLASTSDIIDLEREMLLSDPDYMKNPAGYFATKASKTNAAYMSQVDMLYYRLANGQISESGVESALDRLRRNDYRREYQRELQQNSLTQDYNLSINTGNDRYSFYAALRYEKKGFHTKFDSNHRISFYTRNEINATNWLKLNIGANLWLNKSTYTQASGLGDTAAMPYDTLRDSDGNLSHRYPYNQVLAEEVNATEGLNFMGYNAIEESAMNKYKTDDLYMKYFLQAIFDILPGLNLELKGQYEKRKANSKEYDEADSYMMRSIINEFAASNSRGGFDYYIPLGGRMYNRDANYDNYNVRAQFNYRNTFGEKHDFTALLGAEAREDKSDYHIGERYGYDDQRLTYSFVDWATLSQKGVVGSLYANSRTKSENLNVSEVKHRYVSAYFNAGYVYDSRYSANVSVRVEQADLFGSDPKYRYRPLWSVGGSWNMNKEKFMSDITWIDLLKLRVTYGITGMVDQSSSPYLLASFATSPYSNGPITLIMTPPNSSLRWEKTSTFNAGIDFMLLNRLSGSFDFYNKYSSDLLVNKSIDPSLGFNGMARANNGAMRNLGIELSLSYEWIRNRDFNFTTSFTTAYNKNTIEKVDYKPTDALDMMRYPTYNYLQGDTYNSLYAYRYAGLTENGNPSVYDQNGQAVSINPVRNIGAVICAGQLTPKWNGALSLDFRWRDLTVFAKLVYYAGHSLRVDVPTLYDSNNKILDGNVHESIVDRWTETNKDTDIPVMGIHGDSGERNEHWRYADANIANASFAKLRNIGIAYSIPSSLLRKTKAFRNVQFRFQIDNLFRITSNGHGIDPEAFDANRGVRNSQQTPTYIWGVNINF